MEEIRLKNLNIYDGIVQINGFKIMILKKTLSIVKVKSNFPLHQMWLSKFGVQNLLLFAMRTIKEVNITQNDFGDIDFQYILATLA